MTTGIGDPLRPMNYRERALVAAARDIALGEALAEIDGAVARVNASPVFEPLHRSGLLAAYAQSRKATAALRSPATAPQPDSERNLERPANIQENGPKVGTSDPGAPQPTPLDEPIRRYFPSDRGGLERLADDEAPGQGYMGVPQHLAIVEATRKAERAAVIEECARAVERVHNIVIYKSSAVTAIRALAVPAITAPSDVPTEGAAEGTYRGTCEHVADPRCRSCPPALADLLGFRADETPSQWLARKESPESKAAWEQWCKDYEASRRPTPQDYVQSIRSAAPTTEATEPAHWRYEPDDASGPAICVPCTETAGEHVAWGDCAPAEVLEPLNVGDRVLVPNDPEEYGSYAGRTGVLVSVLHFQCTNPGGGTTTVHMPLDELTRVATPKGGPE